MSVFLETWTGYHLRAPEVLWLALLVPLAVWLRRRRGEASVSFAPLVLLAGRGVPRSLRARFAAAPRWLQGGACLLVCFALARPTVRVVDPVVREGIDVLFVLDRSSSMDERDLDPARTRLDVVREAAVAFVRGRAEDRIGLLAFARFPDVICPPTLDHAAVEAFLDGLERVDRDSAEDQTGIGTAVARACRVLASVPSHARVVILLTDGEENVADARTPQEIEPMEAAALCVAQGVRVYAIQAGRGRTDPDGTFRPIDTEPLRRLAAHTGGRFFEARDAQTLARIYEGIDALERTREDEPRPRLDDRYAGFVACAFFVLLAGWVLERTWLEVAP